MTFSMAAMAPDLPAGLQPVQGEAGNVSIAVPEDWIVVQLDPTSFESVRVEVETSGNQPLLDTLDGLSDA